MIDAELCTRIRALLFGEHWKVGTIVALVRAPPRRAPPASASAPCSSPLPEQRFPTWFVAPIASGKDGLRPLRSERLLDPAHPGSQA